MRIFKFLLDNLWSTLAIILVLGSIYKYNRELFFQGDYEVTYISKITKKSCPLSTCISPGYEIELVNTGYESHKNLNVEILNIPRASFVNFEIKQQRFSAYSVSSKEMPDSHIIRYKVDRSNNGLVFNFGLIPPQWQISIHLSNQNDEQSPITLEEWGKTYVSISGRGSFLFENPYKVVIAQRISDVIELIQKKKKRVEAVATEIQKLN